MIRYGIVSDASWVSSLLTEEFGSDYSEIVNAAIDDGRILVDESSHSAMIWAEYPNYIEIEVVVSRDKNLGRSLILMGYLMAAFRMPVQYLARAGSEWEYYLTHDKYAKTMNRFIRSEGEWNRYEGRDGLWVSWENM